MTVWRDLFNRATLVVAFIFQKPRPFPNPYCSESLAEIDETAGLSSPQFFYHFGFLSPLFPQQIQVKRRKSPVGRQ